MIRINLHEARTHLSRILRELGPGEVIVISRRNVPIAEIRALPQRSADLRPLGLGPDGEEEAVLVLERLPTPHRDPFDRMLVCQAAHHGLAILTPDPLVTAYPVRCVW